MPTLWKRVRLGFSAAVISVLVFHQGMWGVLYLVGVMPPPFPTWAVPSFGVPEIINLCFWGGMWGAVFGLILPWLPASPPMWVRGLGLGVAASMVSLFIVPIIKDQPIAGWWSASAFLSTFMIVGCWGAGVGIILRLLMRPPPGKPV